MHWVTNNASFVCQAIHIIDWHDIVFRGSENTVLHSHDCYHVASLNLVDKRETLASCVTEAMSSTSVLYVDHVFQEERLLPLPRLFAGIARGVFAEILPLPHGSSVDANDTSHATTFIDFGVARVAVVLMLHPAWPFHVGDLSLLDDLVALV